MQSGGWVVYDGLVATGVTMKKQKVSEVRRLYRLGAFVEKKAAEWGRTDMEESALNFIERTCYAQGMEDAMQLIAQKDGDDD